MWVVMVSVLVLVISVLLVTVFFVLLNFQAKTLFQAGIILIIFAYTVDSRYLDFDLIISNNLLCGRENLILV